MIDWQAERDLIVKHWSWHIPVMEYLMDVIDKREKEAEDES